MRETKGNLWTHPCPIKCITTNGFVKSNGRAVMGRGCALAAKQKFPNIDLALGKAIKESGNKLRCLFEDSDLTIVSFPVKHNWWENADLDLIRKSCYELTCLVEDKQWEEVLLPRPGSGNGKLNWYNDVKPTIQDLLSDRVIIITW